MAKNKFKLFNIFLLMGVLLIGIASASYSSEFNSIQKDLGNSLGSETGSERGDGFESEFGQEKELTKEELQKEIIIGGFGDPITKQTLASTTADWTDGFPNPWVNTGFSHLNTNGYEASFFKLYRNSEA